MRRLSLRGRRARRRLAEARRRLWNPPAHWRLLAFCLDIVAVLITFEGVVTHTIGPSTEPHAGAGASAPLEGSRALLTVRDGRLRTNQPPPGKRIALTFDDGPDPKWTPRIDAVLAREHVPGEPNLHTRDLALVRRQESYRVGDVVAYRIPKGEVGAGRVVIHRIVGGSAHAGYVMRGDNRDTPDLWRPRPSDVTGRKWASASAQGRVRAVVLSPLGVATLAGLGAFLLVATDRRKRQPRA